MATALGVLVLIAVAGGPSIESIICRDDGGLSAAAAEPSVLTEARGPSSLDDGLVSCIHGDCHHVSPCAAPSRVLAGAPFAVRAGARRPDSGRVNTDDVQFELMRPPRG